MNLQDKFTELKTRNEGALIAYICAGDPTPNDTRAIVHALARCGADVIELGLPFSDHIADGLTIQAAIERPLESAHAVAYVKKAAETGELGDVVVINLSGRGDKDVYSVAKREGF